MGQALRATFSNKRIYPLLFALWVQLGTYNLFSGTWGVSYLKEVYGLTTLEASSFTTALSFGAAIFGFLLPVISDLFKNRKKPLLVTFGISSALWITLTFFSNYLSSRAVLMLLMFFFGTSGCTTSQMYSMVRETNDPRTLGVSFGACNTIGMSACAYFPIIAGVLMDKHTLAGYTGGILYRKVFGFCAVLCVLALMALFLTQETHCRNIVAARREEKQKTTDI